MSDWCGRLRAFSRLVRDFFHVGRVNGTMEKERILWREVAAAPWKERNILAFKGGEKNEKGDLKGGVFFSISRQVQDEGAAGFSAWDSTIGRVKKVRQHHWDGGKGAFAPLKEDFHSTLRVVAWRTWRRSPNSLEDNMIQIAAHWFSECYPTLSVSRLHLVPHPCISGNHQAVTSTSLSLASSPAPCLTLSLPLFFHGKNSSAPNTAAGGHVLALHRTSRTHPGCFDSITTG